MNYSRSSFYLNDRNTFLDFSEPIVSELYYKQFKIDLLTGEKTEIEFSEVKEELKKCKLNHHYEDPIIYHFFYEAGYLFNDLSHLVKSTTALFIKIKYKRATISDLKDTSDRGTFSLTPLDYPRFKVYKKQFAKVQSHLNKGNCYQINLTSPFYLKFQNADPRDFICNLWKKPSSRAAFAHYTYVDTLDKLFLSNTPECLFKYHDKKGKRYIYSLPIKGTIKLEDQDSAENTFKKLISSRKEQGELYMISDLIRNDLSRIEFKPSEVVSKKSRLDVPGIVHQFSILRTQVSKKVNLYQVMKALFPGGSITGAPKYNVMKFINDIEHYERGFYCGSTVLLYKNIKSASINIRSSEIDFNNKEIKYGSGGGVTLLSEAKCEFDELFVKMNSFLHHFPMKP